MTLGVLEAIRAAGVAVPDELALVAVDDPPWASLVDPPLTVVAQPVQRIAETAMALLLERLDGSRSESSRVVLPLELRARDSCGLKRRQPLEAC